jgi:hypothetical protein
MSIVEKESVTQQMSMEDDLLKTYERHIEAATEDLDSDVNKENIYPIAFASRTK